MRQPRMQQILQRRNDTEGVRVFPVIAFCCHSREHTICGNTSSPPPRTPSLLPSFLPSFYSMKPLTEDSGKEADGHPTRTNTKRRSRRRRRRRRARMTTGDQIEETPDALGAAGLGISESRRFSHTLNTTGWPGGDRGEGDAPTSEMGEMHCIGVKGCRPTLRHSR